MQPKADPLKLQAKPKRPRWVVALRTLCQPAPVQRRAAAAFLSVVTVTCALSYTARALCGGLRLAFEDSFDGTELDRRKWETRYVYEQGTLDTLNDEKQNYADHDNHVVQDGVLSLVARQKTDGTDRFESGMIRSKQTFYFGYFEAKVFLPSARGVWPAFWLNSDYNADGRLSWPPEIDALEYVIDGADGAAARIYSSVKVSKSGAQGGAWLSRDRDFDTRWKFYRNPLPLNQDWQVIGLLWKPGSVAVYLNGRRLYRREYNWVYDDGAVAGPAHVLMNLAVGGNWAGKSGIDTAAFPQALRVDYLRVCQYHQEASGNDPGCSPYLSSPNPAEVAYAAPHHDLPRTQLVAAQLISTPVRAGRSLQVHYDFETVPDHPIVTTLLNAKGQRIVSFRTFSPELTSSRAGPAHVQQQINVPRDLPAGRYRVAVSLGETERPVPLAAAKALGNADGWLRRTVGELLVSPALSCSLAREP